MSLVNENDFDSPGYEYLRSYQNMSNLYNKLVALGYQRDFCSTYKCPPIHEYYFTSPSKNLKEQQFLFTCLSAWLIKDKCHMNLELEPEEYEDPDVLVSVIFEALRLLLVSDDESSGSGGDSKTRKNPVGFPPGRLKQGFGPEVIWALNILADRALELILESEASNKRVIRVVYSDKRNSEPNQRTSGNNFITIGQPFVGGGLTTRPLGSYQIDDVKLLFDDDIVVCDTSLEPHDTSESSDQNDAGDINSATDKWFDRVRRAEHALDDRSSGAGVDDFDSWLSKLDQAAREIDESIMKQSKPVLEAVQMRIDKHLQTIRDKETYLQNNLKSQIEEFLKIWRNYSQELARNNDLSEKVNTKTDEFDANNERLRRLNTQIESRIKELNDNEKLRELEKSRDRLDAESATFNVKIGLLLTVYSKNHREAVSSSN